MFSIAPGMKGGNRGLGPQPFKGRLQIIDLSRSASPPQDRLIDGLIVKWVASLIEDPLQVERRSLREHATARLAHEVRSRLRVRAAQSADGDVAGVPDDMVGSMRARSRGQHARLSAGGQAP